MHEPQPARRLRDHRHRLSDRPPADERSARLRRADRQHLRQHRDRRLPARERVGDAPCCSPASAASCRTCCSGARWSSATCGWRTASCSRAASCRRSATPWRSSTRARSAARRSARPSAIMLAVHNTPFGDIVDTEDDLQPLVASMFRDALRAVTLVGAAMRGAEFDVARLESRAAEGGTTLTELADHLVRDARHPVQDGARASPAGCSRRTASGRTRRSGATLAPVSSDLLGVPLQYTRRADRRDHEPAALRRGAAHARRAGAGRDRPRARQRRATLLDARPAWLTRIARCARRRRRAARSRGARRCEERALHQRARHRDQRSSPALWWLQHAFL